MINNILESLGEAFSTGLMNNATDGRYLQELDGRRIQKAQSNSILQYLSPESTPQQRAQAAQGLVASGASLTDLAKLEEQRRIGEYQQQEMALLQNLPGVMSGGGSPVQGGGGAMPAQGSGGANPTLAQLAPYLMNQKTAPFAKAVLDDQRFQFDRDKFSKENDPANIAAKEAAKETAKANAEFQKSQREYAESLGRFNKVSAEALSKLEAIPEENFGPVGGRMARWGGNEQKQVVHSKLQDMATQIRILAKIPGGNFSNADADRLDAIVGGQIDIGKNALREILTDMQQRFNEFQRGAASPGNSSPADTRTSQTPQIPPELQRMGITAEDLQEYQRMKGSR